MCDYWSYNICFNYWNTSWVYSLEIKHAHNYADEITLQAKEQALKGSSIRLSVYLSVLPWKYYSEEFFL